MDMSEATKLATSAPHVSEVSHFFPTRREYVTAWLNEAEYGFESDRVLQVLKFPGPSAVTEPDERVVGRLGGSNGQSFPIVDLRLGRGQASVSYRDTMLVVVVGSSSGKVGVVVDSVSDLVDVEIAPAQLLKKDFGIATVSCRSTARGLANGRELFSLRIADLDQIGLCRPA